VVVGIDSCEPSGQRVCYNEITYFIRGSGGGFARKCDSRCRLVTRPDFGSNTGMTRLMCSSCRETTGLWQLDDCSMRLGA